jgi:hypothetical protein
MQDAGNELKNLITCSKEQRDNISDGLMNTRQTTIQGARSKKTNA